MKNDITLTMLEELVETLPIAPVLSKGHGNTTTASNSVMQHLAVSTTPSETFHEIAKLDRALAILSPDVGRGYGSFYDSNGTPLEDNWLAIIWAINGLGWNCGKDKAKQWSMLASERYTHEGFEKAWDSYDSSHPNPVGIASLYKRAAEFGLNNQDAPASNSSRYHLIGGHQLLLFPPLNWAIKRVLPATGLAAIVGPSASGKSFLALDAAAAISGGLSWFGHRTQMAPVIYVALEGEAGYRNRVRAYEQERGHPLPDSMGFLIQPFKINDPQDVADLAAVAQKGSVIFIDTLNRAAPTADENSSKDMGQILEGAKALQAATSGLVVLIHHTGKDANRGARGHSSFFAALDGAVYVERSTTGRSWSVAKAKDGEDGLSYSFRLKHHLLGVDSDGDEISSCTVEPDSGGVFSQPKPKGKFQQAALNAIKRAINTTTDIGLGGCSPATRCLKDDVAVSHIVAIMGHVLPNKRNNRARTLLDDLVKGGYLGSGLEGDDGWVWLIDS
jgi:hypothetical protein